MYLTNLLIVIPEAANCLYRSRLLPSTSEPVDLAYLIYNHEARMGISGPPLDVRVCSLLPDHPQTGSATRSPAASSALPSRPSDEHPRPPAHSPPRQASPASRCYPAGSRRARPGYMPLPAPRPNRSAPDGHPPPAAKTPGTRAAQWPECHQTENRSSRPSSGSWDEPGRPQAGRTQL